MMGVLVNACLNTGEAEIDRSLGMVWNQPSLSHKLQAWERHRLKTKTFKNKQWWTNTWGCPLVSSCMRMRVRMCACVHSRMKNQLHIHIYTCVYLICEHAHTPMHTQTQNMQYGAWVLSLLISRRVNGAGENLVLLVSVSVQNTLRKDSILLSFIPEPRWEFMQLIIALWEYGWMKPGSGRRRPTQPC